MGEPAFPVADALHARAVTEGVLVEVLTLEGVTLRFAIHRLALAAMAATLLDAGRGIPPGGPAAPAARIGADAIGLAASAEGDALLVLETGAAALSYALPADSLAAFGRALLDAFPLPGAVPVPHPPCRRHDA